MKKSLFAIPVLVVMAGIGVSCQKESEPLRNDNQNQEFCITATIADVDTKVSYTEDGETHALKQEWEIGDIIIGCDNDKHTYGFRLTAIKENGEATFCIIKDGEYSGTLTDYPTPGVTLHMIYATGMKPTDIDVENEDNILMTVSIANQDLEEFPAFMTADAVATESGVRLCFKNRMAVIGIRNPTMAAANTSYHLIAISGKDIYTRVRFIRTENEIEVTYLNPGAIKKAVNFTSDATNSVSGVTYIAVCPLSTATDMTFEADYIETYKKTDRTMAAGNYYYMTPKFTGGHAAGVLPGLFSLSKGRMVAFSNGNMYYDSGSDAYKFEANQYDYRSDSRMRKDKAVINGELTSTPENTVGMLFWVKNTETSIKPYDKTYGTPSPANSDSDVFFTNDVKDTPNPDFTAEGKKGVWRALADSELRWIVGYSDVSKNDPGVNCRETGSVNGTANALFAKAIVNGVSGIILFPDIYYHPSGLTQPVNINAADADFEGNNYTADQWSRMESAGAVFLPFTGQRDPDTRISFGTSYYWTSTTLYESTAYSLSFTSDEISIGSKERKIGLSVRLVMESSVSQD